MEIVIHIKIVEYDKKRLPSPRSGRNDYLIFRYEIINHKLEFLNRAKVKRAAWQLKDPEKVKYSPALGWRSRA